MKLTVAQVITLKIQTVISLTDTNKARTPKPISKRVSERHFLPEY